MIRNATHADIPRIVEMAQRFYPESPYPAIADMTRESVAGLAILTMESGVMLVAEQDGQLAGMVCLHIDPFLFNPAVSIAHEIVFWVEPEHSGGMLAVRLLKAAESAVKARGATWSRMAVLASSPPQAVGLYERNGYTRSESYYTKKVA
jgi:GNAT superfamily N-acetyltransferase